MCIDDIMVIYWLTLACNNVSALMCLFLHLVTLFYIILAVDKLFLTSEKKSLEVFRNVSEIKGFLRYAQNLGKDISISF